MARHRVVAALIAATTTAACLDPAARRADRDLDEVGRAAVPGRSVRVEPGIVVAITADAVTVRASAPAVTVELGGAPGRVRLRIENLTADAAVDAAGAVAPVATVREVELDAPATVTAAPPSGARPFRFAFVSDVHAGAVSTPAIAAALAAEPDLAFVVSGGDLVDTGSAAAEWDRTLAAFASLPCPLYGTNGNHELNGGDGEEHHARFGRMNVAFDYHGARLALVDSGSGTLAPRVVDLLDAALAAPGAGLRVFVTHMPPVDPSGLRNGGFSSRLEGEALLARLAARGVDLALYGHLHTFAAWDDGGIRSWLAGGGAESNSRLDDVGLHYLVVELDPAGGGFSVERRDVGE